MAKVPPDDPQAEDGWPPFPARLADIGLPVGKRTRIQSVAFNQLAATFVAVLQPFNIMNSADQRVFLRQVSEPRYREVELPDPLASVTDCVVCATAPIAVLNVMKWTGPERRGANELGLYRVFLPSGSLEELPTPTDPITTPETISVKSIVAASADGDELHLIVSRPVCVRVPPDIGYAVGFFLARYAVDSGIVVMIDEVPAAFA